MSVTHPPDRDEDDGDPAREGTCAAWVAEVVINGDAGAAEDMLGKVHANGWEVDTEMVRHVQFYINLVMGHSNGQVRAEVFGEHPIGLAGTADSLYFAQRSDRLFIWDLKYGFGYVNAYINWQLLCYLWLWVAKHNHYPETVELAIVQPRGQHQDGPFRSRVMTRLEYEPLLGQISTRIQQINDGLTTAVPGPQCNDCMLAHGCAALGETVYRMMDVVMQSRVYRRPNPQQLADEVTLLHNFGVLYKARLKATEAEAVARLIEGSFVPGYHLEQRVGKNKFTVSDAAIQMITGIDPIEKKTCTPAELIRRGANKEVVKTITAIPNIGMKLEKIDPEDVTAKFNRVMKG